MFRLDRACDPAETEVLAAHLDSDPNARAYAVALRSGQLSAWRGVIVDVAGLGELWTILGVLGSGDGARVAKALTGNETFRVGEALEAWRESRGDEAALMKLESYIVDARSGKLRNRTVTIREWSPAVVDGTKRGIAIHDAARPKDFPMTVYVLRRSSG